jgi:hypothetical protein
MKHLTRCFFILAFVISLTAGDALAQLGIGASFERRNESPTNGFGFQLEFELFKAVPLVNIRARLHGSYFSEESDFSLQGALQGVQLGSAKVESTDFGAAALGGVSLGLLRPYIGVGVGSENWSFRPQAGSSPLSIKRDDDSFYYYGVAGVAFTLIPFIKPYAEYRLASYDSISDARKEIGEGPSRFHIGVTLTF